MRKTIIVRLAGFWLALGIPTACLAATTPASEAARAERGRDAPDSTYVPEDGVRLKMLPFAHRTVVPVMVNGRGPYHFEVDTGGGGTARVDSALADAMGLEVIGQARAGDPSGKVRLMNLVRVDSIQVGAARFGGLVAAVRNYNDRRPAGERIDGVLGFGLFHDCLLTLDYPDSTVRIAAGQLPPANGGDVIPFVSDRGIPSVQLQVDTLTVDADLDAGSMGGFSLPARLIAKLPLAAAPQTIGHARTVTSEFDIQGAQLEGTVRLAGLEFANPKLEFQPVFPMANVGSRVLEGLQITFDQRNRRVRVGR